MVENISAREQTISELREKQSRLHASMQQTIGEIERRIEQENSEFKRIEEAIALEKVKNEITAFENSLGSIEKPALEAISSQNEATAQWLQKSLTANSVYPIVAFAIEQCIKVKRDIRFISVPEKT